MELEKIDYYISKLENQNYNVKEYIDYAINSGDIIKLENVKNYRKINENTNSAIVQIDGYSYLINYEFNDIKITYNGKVIPSESDNIYSDSIIEFACEYYNTSNDIDWNSTFPLENSPVFLGELQKNGDYGFTVADNMLIPENKLHNLNKFYEVKVYGLYSKI